MKRTFLLFAFGRMARGGKPCIFDIVNGFFNRRGDAVGFCAPETLRKAQECGHVLLTDVVNIWLRFLSASVTMQVLCRPVIDGVDSQA